MIMLKESLKDAVNGICITIQVILSALLFFKDSPIYWTFLIDILFLYYIIIKSPIASMITNSVTFMLLVLVLLFLSYFIESLLDRIRDFLRNQELWEVWK